MTPLGSYCECLVEAAGPLFNLAGLRAASWLTPAKVEAELKKFGLRLPD